MSVHVSTPEWPSLYDPLVEFHDWQHHDPIQPRGRYIYNANDVFRYTFYWTLIFHAPFFIFSGTLAFINIVHPAHRHLTSSSTLSSSKPSERSPPQQKQKRTTHPMYQIPLTPLRASRSPDVLLATPSPEEYTYVYERPGPPQRNVHRSRLVLALLTLLVFLAASVGTALVESIVVGYLLVAVFHAAHFNMSTWIPPIWALIITAAEVLGVFPTVIDRI